MCEGGRAPQSGDTAIVPGNVDKSTLVAHIFSDDADEIMPPPKSHKKLTSWQKETLKRWVAEGAGYEKHWAYLPVPPVNVPAAADLPKADAELLKWPRNEIDWFILQKLAQAGLKPSPRAEPSTLVRRIALDLTGLPPREETAEAIQSREARRLYQRELCLAALWRAHGGGLARRRALRRHAGLPGGSRPGHAPVARLGDRGVQQEHAV